MKTNIPALERTSSFLDQNKSTRKFLKNQPTHTASSPNFLFNFIYVGFSTVACKQLFQLKLKSKQ